MLEYLLPIVLLTLGIFAVRKTTKPNILSQLLRWLVTIYSVVCIIVLGVGVFLWNPINNQTNKSIWFSWDSMLSNASIAVGVILGEWIVIRLIWKKSKQPAGISSVAP